ncbi:hypothetical protein [Rubrimonas cliftonensis]|uniref:hypothetical protein n=1 Tax=Rubrimonas cliftonensis TaxID=89524 RepID=UPI001114E1B0|nr:hypothetical protein [Rubrimonas cliftonensis]
MLLTWRESHSGACSNHPCKAPRLTIASLARPNWPAAQRDPTLPLAARLGAPALDSLRDIAAGRRRPRQARERGVILNGRDPRRGRRRRGHDRPRRSVEEEEDFTPTGSAVTAPPPPWIMAEHDPLGPLGILERNLTAPPAPT